MSKYEAWHPLEAGRVIAAMKSRDVAAGVIGADGRRKPFGEFGAADLAYWSEFATDSGNLMMMQADLGEWAAAQLAAGGWETLADAPADVLAEAKRREQAVIAEIKRLGPITDDIVQAGALYMKIPDQA